MGEWESKVTAGPLTAAHQEDLEVRYVRTEEEMYQMIAAINAASIVSLDIETAPDLEGEVRREQDKQIVTAKPYWTPLEERIIGGDVNPPGEMTYAELDELRHAQKRILLENAASLADETDARMGSLDMSDAEREHLQARLDALRPYLAEREQHLSTWGSTKGNLKVAVGRRPIYGLAPSEAVPRLIQVGIDEPGGKRVQWVLDCFEVDPRPVAEALGRAGLIKLIYNADFERIFFGYHYGVELNDVIDLYRVWKDLADALEAAGLPRPERLGLAPVFEFLAKTPMSKEQQLSDWKAFILSQMQLDYAAIDVAVLPGLLVSSERLAAQLDMDPGTLRPRGTSQWMRKRIAEQVALRPDEREWALQKIAAAHSDEDLDAAEAYARRCRLTAEGREVVELEAIERRHEIGQAISIIEIL